MFELFTSAVVRTRTINGDIIGMGPLDSYIFFLIFNCHET